MELATSQEVLKRDFPSAITVLLSVNGSVSTFFGRFSTQFSFVVSLCSMLYAKAFSSPADPAVHRAKATMEEDGL